MIAYLVNQIILARLTYLQVVTARPDLKQELDAYIEDNNLIVDKTV